MKLYNTLSRTIEEFKPIIEGQVSMYHCGPTVYDNVHIGNLRAFVFADLVRRVFEYEKYEVRQVMNITDIDDKTIHRAQEEKISLQELTYRFTESFFEDIEALNILRPKEITKALDHIPEMVALIEKLLAKGLAYKGEDGSVYFSISKSEKYGTLAGLAKMDRREGARIHNDEYTKEDINDFVLWKAWNEKDGEVFWETSLGKGRPGWHIECSAMSMKYLGETFDIHTGGIDLIFPHHTNEIAQSEGATGKPFVRTWLHNEFITVDGEKMAKSKGNFFTLQNIIENGLHPLAYRYWLLTAHYRKTSNFTWEAVKGAESAFMRLSEHFRALSDGISGKEDLGYLNQFKECVEDDLDTPRAIAIVWQLVKDHSISSENKRATLAVFNTVLGLGLDQIKTEPIPEEIQKLVALRTIARANKDWERSDLLRDEIQKTGFVVEDTDKGDQRVKKL